jgi:hypothetical protein
MIIRTKKWTFQKKLFFFLLLMWHNIFYLLPENILFLERGDIVFGVCVLVFFGYVINLIRYDESLVKTRYMPQMVFVFMLILISAFMASIHVSQGIYRGIVNQMGWIGISLTYFPIALWIKKEQLSSKDIEECIIIAAFCEVFLSILQFYIVGTNHMFLVVKTNERYETARLYVNSAYMNFALAIFARQVAKVENVKKSIIAIFLLLLVLATIIKSRIGIVIALTIMVGTFLLSKDTLKNKANRTQKKLIRWGVLIAGVFVVCAFMKSNLIHDFVNAIQNPLDDGSATVRMNAIDFYMTKWRSSNMSFLLGYGYTTTEMSLYRYIIADNGIFAFLFLYGAVGLVWVLSFAWKTIHDGWVIKKQEKDASLLIFAICNFMGLSVSYFSGSYFAYSMILMAAIEAKLIEMKNRREKSI